MDHLNEMLAKAQQLWVDDRWAESLALISKCRALATEHQAEPKLQATLAELSLRVTIDEYECHVKNGGLVH